MLLITILLLAVFTISAVSAGDNLTVNDEGQLQGNPCDEIELNDDADDDIVSSSEGNTENENGTFEQLKEMIENTENTTVTLENDYVYEGEGYNKYPITIGKSMTIDGNGHKIDGKSKSCIFRVSEKNITVTFKNITFINAFSTSNAAAIENGYYINEFRDSICNVVSCNFTNISGTAISYATNIKSCTFTNCHCMDDVCTGENMISCNFTNCYAESNSIPSVVTIKQNITSSNFTNCYSNGFTVISADNTIESCIFTNCASNSTERYEGGAICGWENIISCNFTNIKGGSHGQNIISCNFTNMKDGAVYNSNNIEFCIFNNCYCESENGGAINSDYCISIIKNCVFLNCFSYNGGAIYASDSQCNISLCNFTNCSANSNGGAIYYSTLNYVNERNCKINKCNFISCSAGNNGGAIKLSEIGETNITSCIFTNCSSKSGDGGSIGVEYAKKGNIQNCVFLNSSSKNGGAIYTLQAPCNINLCDFTNCSANSNGGAIYNSMEYGKCEIDKCNFIRCSAGNDGGVIYNIGDKTTLKNSLFVNNTAKNYPDIYSDCPITLSNNTYIGNDTKDKPEPKNDGKSSNNPKTPSIKLTLKKVNVKKSAKKLVIQASLKINGKAVKGKVIKFKFNKKTYKAKTNKKGVAKVTVKKSVLKKLKVGKKVKIQAAYGKTNKKLTVKVKK